MNEINEPPPFSATLRAARKRIGLTQRQCDAILGTAAGQTATWESGRNIPHNLTQLGVMSMLHEYQDGLTWKATDDPP